MAIFLRWRDTQDGTFDRFLVSMFSSLSSRYYPTNIIGSGLYDTLSMYANEFEDSYTEIQQTFNDLSIDTVRTTPVTDRSSAKIYDNFGALFDSSKRYDQYYDRFSTGSVVQSYRQQLRFLAQAFLSGISVEGFKRLGQSFTGTSPLIEEHIKANPRWILTVYTGSVLEVGQGFLISDIYIPRIGNVIPIVPQTTVSGPFETTPPWSVGDNFSLSFSHLGSNTKLSGEHLFYSTVLITYFNQINSVSSQSILGLHNQIEYQSLRITRADQQIRTSYSDVFTYYRPYEAYTYPSHGLPPVLPSGFSLNASGFIYNNTRLHPTGSVVYTPVLDLGSNYANYSWYYDWLINTREYGDYDIEVRQYSTSSIPDVAYYVPIVDSDQALPLLLPDDLTKDAVHWMNVRSGSIYDIRGRCYLPAVSIPAHEVRLTRDPRRYCYLYDGLATFRKNEDSSLDVSTSMYAEIWLLGLSKTISSVTNTFTIRRDKPPNNLFQIFLDSSRKTIGLQLVKDGFSETVSASIASHLDLETKMPHLFALSFASGSVYFYTDGQLIGSGNFSNFLGFPDLSPATQSIIMNANGMGIDEILISQGFLSEEQAYIDFINTRPRYTYTGIPSGSVQRYQQAKFTFYGYNIRDVELHQFSVVGTQEERIFKYLNPYFNYPYILPVFKKL